MVESLFSACFPKFLTGKISYPALQLVYPVVAVLFPVVVSLT